MSGAEAPRKTFPFGRIALVAVAVLLLLSPIILLNLQGISFAIAYLMSEQRPELLRDAGWNDPASAKAFNARFPAGSPTSELESWLKANRFEIDPAARTARFYRSAFPCAEIIEVTWSTTPDGKLTEATALIPPGGCI